MSSYLSEVIYPAKNGNDLKVILDYVNFKPEEGDAAHTPCLSICRRIWSREARRMIGVSHMIPLDSVYKYIKTRKAGERGEPNKYAREVAHELVPFFQLDDDPDTRRRVAHAILDAFHKHFETLIRMPPYLRYLEARLEEEMHLSGDKDPLAEVDGVLYLPDGRVHKFKERVH
jgi:hypothetical protein